MKNDKYKLTIQNGFTITEIAVVATIIGVLTVGSVSMYSEKKRNVQWTEAESRLIVVKSALLNFVSLNKFMPCPDDPSNSNGMESRGANGVSCKVSTGLLPYKDLDLSKAEVLDSWGNDFTYIVNRDTTDNNILQPNSSACPENSACFFSNSRAPAFDLETLPMMGETVVTNMAGSTLSTSVKNFRVCNDDECDQNIEASKIVGEALIAVVVAHNENGGAKTGLKSAETKNLGSDNYFVKKNFNSNEFFDDLLITISGNELKNYYDTQLVELENDKKIPFIPPSNTIGESDRMIEGGSGNDGRFSQNIGVNVVEVLSDEDNDGDGEKDRIKFDGKGNEWVTVTFKTKVEGGWEDANANKEGRFAEYSGSNIETKDTFVVGFNNEELGVDIDGDGAIDRSDITNIDYLNEIGNDMSKSASDRVVDRARGLDIFGVDESIQNSQFSYYDEQDNSDNTWYEYESYNVKLNDEGELEMFFANFSTATDEKVTVQDLDVVLYDEPTSVPPTPDVKGIGSNSKTIDDIIRDGEL